MGEPRAWSREAHAAHAIPGCPWCVAPSPDAPEHADIEALFVASGIIQPVAPSPNAPGPDHLRLLSSTLGYYLDTESERPVLGLPSVAERVVQHLVKDDGWIASFAALALPPRDALDVDLIRKALTIGQISHDGDGWFAKEAGFDYDDAEQTIKAAFAALREYAAQSEETP